MYLFQYLLCVISLVFCNFVLIVVECVAPSYLVQLTSDDQDGTFETTDNYPDGSPTGPTDTPDDSVPVFGSPSPIQPDSVNETPYTVTIKTPGNTDDTPMTIATTLENVDKILVSVDGNPPLEVKYTLVPNNNLVSGF